MAGVYNIPFGLPFLHTLADFIDEKCGKDSLERAKLLVLLPSRRSCLELRDVMLTRLGSENAMLMPRICPIADIDEGEIPEGESLLKN